MKNKSNLFSVIFMAFGITGLDFENLNFENNYKSYILLIISFILFMYSIINKRKNNKIKK